MVTVRVLHAGKAVVQVAAVQIPVNDLLEIGSLLCIASLRTLPL